MDNDYPDRCWCVLYILICADVDVDIYINTAVDAAAAAASVFWRCTLLVI